MESKILVSGKQTKVGSSLKNYVIESLSLTLKNISKISLMLMFCFQKIHIILSVKSLYSFRKYNFYKI